MAVYFRGPRFARSNLDAAESVARVAPRHHGPRFTTDRDATSSGLRIRGRNSAVECQLPKLDVTGSNPVARSLALGLGPSFTTWFTGRAPTPRPKVDGLGTVFNAANGPRPLTPAWRRPARIQGTSIVTAFQRDGAGRGSRRRNEGPREWTAPSRGVERCAFANPAGPEVVWSGQLLRTASGSQSSSGVAVGLRGTGARGSGFALAVRVFCHEAERGGTDASSAALARSDFSWCMTRFA